jgi:modulator of FtsH protease HflK
MMRWLCAICGLLLIGWLLTGVTQIRPGERAIVRRFGRVVAEPGPGLWIGFPWGIDRVDRVQVDKLQHARIGYNPELQEPGNTTPNGQLLTGDHNLVNVSAVVDYTVRPDRVDDFLIQQERVNGLVTRTAEAALAEWVAGRTVDDVLLTSNAVLPPWLVEQAQKRLDAYGLGVRVQFASIHVQPPDEVRSAFDNVTREQTLIDTKTNDARQKANTAVRTAEGNRFEMEQQTAAYANQQLRMAETEAEAFTRRLAQYRTLKEKNPNLLAAIWWDEMGKVFERLNRNGRIDVLDNHLGPDGLDITMFATQPRRK